MEGTRYGESAVYGHAPPLDARSRKQRQKGEPPQAGESAALAARSTPDAHTHAVGLAARATRTGEVTIGAAAPGNRARCPGRLSLHYTIIRKLPAPQGPAPGVRTQGCMSATVLPNARRLDRRIEDQCRNVNARCCARDGRRRAATRCGAGHKPDQPGPHGARHHELSWAWGDHAASPPVHGLPVRTQP